MPPLKGLTHIHACTSVLLMLFFSVIITGSAVWAQTLPGPTGLSLTSTSSSLIFAWNTESGAVSYNVYRAINHGSFSLYANTTSTSYTDTGVSSGTLYDYQVAGVDSTGTAGTRAGTWNGYPIGPPSTITVQCSDSDTHVSWPEVPYASGYSVYRATTSGGETSSSGVAYVGQTSSPGFTDYNLTDGVTYYYIVNCNSTTDATSAVSVASPEGSGMPFGKPTSLTATDSGSGQVTIAWAAGTADTAYNVYRNTTSTVPLTSPIASNVSTTSYVDTTATNGVLYYYTVAAVQSSFLVGEGHTAYATPIGNPSNLIAVPGASGNALSWTAAAGATSYAVYRGTSAGAESSSVYASPTGTTYNDTGASAGVTYYYYVKAVIGYPAVTSTYYSAATNEASSTAVAPPPTPTGFTGTPGNGVVNLSWNASTGAVSYQIWRGTGTTSLYQTISSTSYSDTGVVNGTSYNYKIFAVNTYGGTSSSTGTLSETPIANPIGLTATPGNAQVVLTWPADTGASGYNIYRGLSSGSESGTALTSVSGTTYTYTNTGLTNGTSYFYTIKAKSGSTYVSNASNEASATPVAPPAAPTGLTAASGIQSIGLSWTATSGATSYNLYRSTTSGSEGSTAYLTGLTGTSYTDTAVPGIQPYYYKLAAVNAGGTSAQSSEASAAPQIPAPSGLTITVNTATPITGTTAGLTGSATGTGTLTYAWSCSPSTTTFSPTSGANTTLTFPAAGTYMVTLTVTDPNSQQTTATTSIAVQQTPTTVAVSPASATVAAGASQSFAASESDQFGSLMTTQPAWAWSATVGTVDASGNYTAPLAPGTDAVKATDPVSGLHSTSSITVTNPAAPSALAVTVNTTTPIIGTAASLTGSATGTGTLTYTWSCSPTATFSPVSGANTTLTFPAAGTYTVTLTVTDSYSQQATATKSIVVQQTATSVAVSPASATVAAAGSQSFTASETDQFGSTMTVQPTWTWSAAQGTITSTGGYTAPLSTGTDTVTAADTAATISGTVNVSIGVPAPPSAATITVNTPTPITGTTASLTGSAIGTGTLTYAWSCIPTATFSPSAAAITTLTFPATGTYTVTLTVTDAYRQQVTATQSITVIQALSSITVSPTSVSVGLNGIKTFFATTADQFSNIIDPSPVSWSVDPGSLGSVDQNGTYTASSTEGTATVRASNGNVSGAALVTISATPPTVSVSASASPNPVAINSTSELRVYGADSAGESSLTYTWTAVGTPPAPVTFSINGSNTAKSTVGSFSAAGTYNLVVTIADPSGLSVTSNVTVTVVSVAAPSGIIATPGNSVVLLTWPQVPGATGYKVYRVSGGTYTNVGWLTNPQNAFTDTAVANGTNYSYAITSLAGTSESSYSSTTASVTPQVQPGTWAFSYAPASSTTTSTPDNSQISTVTMSTGGTAFSSSEVAGSVSGTPVTAQSEAAQSGTWTATWTPNSSGAWPTLLVLSDSQTGTFLADVANGSGTASVISADGSINVTSSFPSTDVLLGPTPSSSTTWNLADPTCPIRVVASSIENKTAEYSSTGTAIGWLHTLSNSQTTYTYLLGSYLQANFATTSAISIHIQVPTIDITSSVVVSSTGSQGDATASGQSTNKVTGD